MSGSKKVPRRDREELHVEGVRVGNFVYPVLRKGDGSSLSNDRQEMRRLKKLGDRYAKIMKPSKRK